MAKTLSFMYNWPQNQERERKRSKGSPHIALQAAWTASSWPARPPWVHALAPSVFAGTTSPLAARPVVNPHLPSHLKHALRYAMELHKENTSLPSGFFPRTSWCTHWSAWPAALSLARGGQGHGGRKALGHWRSAYTVRGLLGRNTSMHKPVVLGQIPQD